MDTRHYHNYITDKGYKGLKNTGAPKRRQRYNSRERLITKIHSAVKTMDRYTTGQNNLHTKYNIVQRELITSKTQKHKKQRNNQQRNRKTKTKKKGKNKRKKKGAPKKKDTGTHKKHKAHKTKGSF